MDLWQQFEVLGRKQLAVQEGIDLLRQAQLELARTRSSADAWGQVAILSNVVLIPLNCIVNAFELKAANSAYQLLVRAMYDKVAKSGTRLDRNAKSALALLKQAIVDQLKRKALTDYVPGVNILVGLAEDSLALWQSMATVDTGMREIHAISAQVDMKISAAVRELMRLGNQRAQVLARMDVISRTA